MKIDSLNKTINNFNNHIIGRCNICNHFTVFVCLDITMARNNMFCLFCRSSSRKRHVAKTIITKVSKDKNISSFSEIPKLKNIKIFNTETNDAFSKVLQNYESYVCSDLFPDVEIGTLMRERVFCQDLEKLTFDDRSFDLVITEDIFEHVRDHIKGFKQISRILKIGGHHIFTVPCFFDRPTLIRVDTTTDKDIHLFPPEYHGDPIRGKILAYRTYGIDIFDLLKSFGFRTTVHFSQYYDLRNGIVDSYVFDSENNG